MGSIFSELREIYVSLQRTNTLKFVRNSKNIHFFTHYSTDTLPRSRGERDQYADYRGLPTGDDVIAGLYGTVVEYGWGVRGHVRPVGAVGRVRPRYVPASHGTVRRVGGPAQPARPSLSWREADNAPDRTRGFGAKFRR